VYSEILNELLKIKKYNIHAKENVIQFDPSSDGEWLLYQNLEEIMEKYSKHKKHPDKTGIWKGTFHNSHTNETEDRLYYYDHDNNKIKINVSDDEFIKSMTEFYKNIHIVYKFDPEDMYIWWSDLNDYVWEFISEK